MKTLEFIAEHYKSECIDSRDINRLLQFVPFNMVEKFGIKLKDEWNNEEKWNATIKPFTRENILVQLQRDVEFGFEKALGKRGISSSLMYNVVKMWNWILEEGLEDFDNYPMYGLPLFKATALKYGFENPIGDDSGSEDKYDENEEW